MFRHFQGMRRLLPRVLDAGGGVMERLWDYCAFCGKRIETGEKCYGLPNGDSVCTDCCVEENEGADVSDEEEEQEDDNG